MVWTAVAAAFVVEPRFTSRTISLFCSGLTLQASTHLHSPINASSCSRTQDTGDGQGGGGDERASTGSL